MNERLSQFISYKTGGNQKDFATLLGWSPQYLHKMLKGDSMGIQPVISLLQAFPELNARWLIVGEGEMIDKTAISRRLSRMYDLEKYIPVMTSTEIGALVSGKTDFGNDTIERWETLLGQKLEEINIHFEAAYKRQRELDNREAVLSENGEESAKKLVNNS